MIEVRTELQIKRAETAAKVCSWWRENYDPSRGSRRRFLVTAAAQFGLTDMGVRGILLRNNLYPKA